MNGIQVSVLDHDTLTRDLRNCIATFPVLAMHLGRQIQVRLLSTIDLLEVQEAGIRDSMSLGVVAARDDFQGILPKSMDDFYIYYNNNWQLFQVRDVPDYFDPRVHIIQINLKGPTSGIT